MRKLLLFLMIAGACVAGENPSVARDGQYWVRSGQTELRLGNQVKRIEILTRANVIVRGSSEGGLVQLKLRQRVVASTTEEADRAWGPVTQIAPFIAVGNLLRWELTPRGSSRVITELEISLPKQLDVAVSNQIGSVEMYDLDGSVQADTGGGPLRMDRIRGSLRGHTGFGEIRLGVIGGSVQCSSGGGSITLENAAGEMNCVTGGGDIFVRNASGAVAVSTEGGNIRVEQGGSTVRARSVAGLIDIVQARGAVFANTGGGSIQIGSANGIRAESAAGSIRVKGGSGPMTVSTILGNIVAELLAGGRFADSSLISGSGDVTVLIPAGLGLTVRARNDSGISPRIVSDFPEIEVRSVGFRSPQGQGTINGGGPVLDLNTNDGAIYLRRTK